MRENMRRKNLSRAQIVITNLDYRKVSAGKTKLSDAIIVTKKARKKVPRKTPSANFTGPHIVCSVARRLTIMRSNANTDTQPPAQTLRVLASVKIRNVT